MTATLLYSKALLLKVKFWRKTSASHGSLLQSQNLSLHLDWLNQNLHFKKIQEIHVPAVGEGLVPWFVLIFCESSVLRLQAQSNIRQIPQMNESMFSLFSGPQFLNLYFQACPGAPGPRMIYLTQLPVFPPLLMKKAIPCILSSSFPHYASLVTLCSCPMPRPMKPSWTWICLTLLLSQSYHVNLLPNHCFIHMCKHFIPFFCSFFHQA